MRALFVTNQRKTLFYSAVARRMRDFGADIFWISVSTLWTDYLVDQGWSRDSILSLPDFGPEWSSGRPPSAADADRIRRIEATSETSFKNILIMDRELSKRSGLDTPAYVYVAVREMERFVRTHAITAGFGESTWAPELMASEVLRANDGRYFMPLTVRVPSSRFCFFEGIFHDKIAHVTEPTEEHHDIARRAIAHVREKGARPYYFSMNMNPQRLRRHWVDEVLTVALNPRAHHFDHSVPDLLARSRRRLRKRVFARAASRSSQFQQPPRDSDAPFVLVTLHVQPEASVDVLGGAKNNQLEAIRALTRLLPFGHEIWVKEHGHALGDRAPTYYQELSALPGLRLIDASADTMSLIRKARLVVSVSGTACLEAAVMGVPAATLGKIIWKPILIEDDLNPFGMCHQDMAALLERADRWRQERDRDTKIESFITWLVAQSFEGIISDPASDPNSVDPKNVDRVAAAMVRILQSRRCRKSQFPTDGDEARLHLNPS